MFTEVAGRYPGHRHGVDIGDGDLGRRMGLQEQSRHRAVARAEFEDLRVGHIGEDVECQAGELLLAFHVVVDVIAVEVLVSVGLQHAVQAGCVEATAGHRGDVG